MMRGVLWMLLLAASVLPASVSAQSYQYHVYLNIDLRGVTGCTVDGVDGQAMTGVDYRLTAVVSGTPPVVTERRLAACSGGSFGAGSVLPGTYPVGLNNGTALGGGLFADVVELSVSRQQIPGAAPMVAVGFGAASDGVLGDATFTHNGLITGSPLGVGTIQLIPTAGVFALLVLGTILAVIALLALRRNGRLTKVLLVCACLSFSLAAWAMAFMDDGEVADWSSTATLGTDAVGDAVLSATDIVAVYGADDDPHLRFRIDVVDAENRPPLAVDDSYSVLEDQTLAIAAPGVLVNDSDPDGDSISAQLDTDVANGTLVLNADGSFSYQPDPNSNGVDGFSYFSFDGQVTSLSPASVSITVTPVNDAPVFTVGGNQTVLEDAGAQSVPGWATAIDDGDPEVTQALSFEITGNTNAALFSVAPAVSPTGTLSYTPAANANGSATITLQLRDDGGLANGGVDVSATQSFTISVTAVNDAPSFTAGADQTVLEDAGAQTVTGWATAISAGPPDESGQTLTFNLTGNTNAALFSSAPAVSPTGVLTFTPAANANGSAMITLVLMDNGGTADGGANSSAPQTVTITVTAVNDAPSFTAGPDQTALEDAGPQSLAWATAISAGPPNESGQALQFQITGNSNAALFSTAPAVSATGVLTYTAAANANGVASITLRLMDNGGTTDGGIDVSPTQTFSITVTAVNDAPTYVVGADQTVAEDGGAQTVTGWATAISAGPPDESGQGLTFNVTGNTNAALFSAQPAVSATTGTLSYTPAANTSGTATVTLRLMDNGGTTNGGVDTSAAQTFVITVTAVNDPPVNSVPGPQQTADTTPLVFSTANGNAISVSDLDAGSGIVSMTFATGAAGNGTLTLANPGGGLATLTGNGTATVVATGTITALNTALNGPSGALTYTPVPGSSAVRMLTVTTSDQGNTGAPGPLTDVDVIDISVDAAPVVSVTPTGGSTIANNAAFVIGFSESVNVTAGITLTCGGGNLFTGGTTGAGVTSLSPTYSAPLPSGACTLTVPAASVSDVDVIDPPNNPAANFVASFTVDAAPTVVGTTPTGGATIANDIDLTFTFDEPVTFSAASFTLECPGGTPFAGGFAVSGSGTTTATINPTGPLPSGACTVTAIAANISDVDAFDPPQNPAANTAINFTVDAPPGFVSATPAAAAVVGTGQTVSFTFNENVTNLGGAITLNCGAAVTGAISGSGTPTLTFTPSAALAPGASCTATAVAAQIGDSDAFDPPQNPTADVVRSFTVDTAPAVTSTVPANNATNVGLGSNLIVNFSEPVNFTGAAFTLNCPAGNPIPFTLSGIGTSQATINPTPATLPINTVCVLTINAALIQDVDSADPPDVGAGTTTVSFTTVNDNAPTVATNPAGGGSNVAVNSNITVTFNEPVTLTGGWFALGCPTSGLRTSTGELTGSGITIIENTPDLVYTIDPTADLAGGEQCTITIDSANVADNDAIDPPNELDGDGSGDTIDGDADDYVAQFTTVDVAPTVTSTSPMNGAVVANSAVFQAVFSEPVNLAMGALTLDCGGPIAVTPGGSGTNTATFTPATPLPNGASCTATLVAANISDVDSIDPPDTLPANVVVNFSVDAAPSVVSISPPSGTTSLNPGSTITITFSESVNFDTTPNAGNSSFDFECPAGSAVNFSVVGASPASSVVLDPLDTAVATRDCSVIVRAAGIADADTIDPPNTMAADFTATLGFGGVPVNDTYSVTPHLTLAIGASSPQGGGVLNNDLVGSGVVTSFGFGTCNDSAAGMQYDAGAANGRLTLNADGSFSYEPPAGVSNAVRTFCYTVTGGTNAFILFSIANTELVWFADQAAAVGGIGTQARPFQTVNAAGAVDTAGDTIFIASGNYPATELQMETQERVIGAGSTQTVTAFTGIAPVAGSAFPAVAGVPPVLSCSDEDCVQLSSVAGNSHALRGFTIGDSGVTSGRDIAGNGFGTLTVAELTLTGNGTALDLSTGTLNGNFLDINATAGDNGIDLSAVGGSWTVTASVDVGNVSGTAINIVNMPAGGSVSLLGGLDIVKSSAGAGLNLNANLSPVTLGAISITTGAGPAMTIDNSTSVVTISSGSVSATGGPAINSSGSTLSITLTNASSTNSSTQGINLNNLTGTVSLAGGAISGAAGTAFLAQGTLGTTSYDGTISKTSAGKLIAITGASTGNVSLGGNLSCSGSCTGIDVLNRGVGLLTFTGASKVLSTGINPAVTLDNNDLATIHFTNGGLAITTTSGVGFNAINGAAAVTVQGTGNSITSTTGTALNVVGTTIGSAGLNFIRVQSIGGTANGIVLDNTGSNGGLTVLGSGTAGSGGTISNKTGADGTGQGNGIRLNATSNVRLNWMQLSTFSNSAVVGTNVSGFTLANSVISGTVGDNSGAVEGPLAFGVVGSGVGLTGNSLIDNVDVSGSIEHQIEIYNASGTLNLTVRDSRIHDGGVDGLQMEIRGTAQALLLVDGSEIFNMGSQAIQLSALESSNLQATITDNTITRGTQGNEGMVIQNGGDADLRALIDGNTVSGFGGVALFAGQVAGQGTAASLLEVTITDNIVTSPLSATNHAILGFVSSLTGQISQARFLIDGNTVNYASDAARAILIDAPDTGRTPAFNATITNNVVNSTNAGALTMISVAARNGSTGRSLVTGNDVNLVAGADGINVREASAGSNVLGRGTSASNDSSVVLSSNNPLSTTVVLPSAADIPVVENATILQPVLPTLPGLPLLIHGKGHAWVPGLFSPAAPASPDVAALDETQLPRLVDLAIERWAWAGASPAQLAAMRQTRFVVHDLVGGRLGVALGDLVQIDDDAAGWGWFIDPTPSFDEEFAENGGFARSGSGAEGRLDLVTVLMHELGHRVGLTDHPGEASVMHFNLPPGMRRTPEKVSMRQWAVEQRTVSPGASNGE